MKLSAQARDRLRQTLRKGVFMYKGRFTEDRLLAEIEEVIESLRSFSPEMEEVIRERLQAAREIDENGCWLWTKGKDKDGYGRMGFTYEGDVRMYKVHRLAAALWLHFDIDSELSVCHHCDNPPCFNPDHLFIGTALDNATDKMLKGRCLAGEGHPNSKLTEEDVQAIIAARSSGKSRQEVATAFGASVHNVDAIWSGRAWPHVPRPSFSELVKAANSPTFAGATFEPKYDAKRLVKLLDAVFRLMKDGQWRTLREIADKVGGSEGGVHARLRDFRKPEFGGHAVERRRLKGGLFAYRLVLA